MLQKHDRIANSPRRTSSSDLSAEVMLGMQSSSLITSPPTKIYGIRQWKDQSQSEVLAVAHLVAQFGGTPALLQVGLIVIAV